MKRVGLIIIFVFLGLLCTGIFYSEAATIRITSPKPGESWFVNNSYQVKWQVIGSLSPSAKVKIVLRAGGVKVKNISPVPLPASSGVFQWMIPQSLKVGNYMLLIKTVDNRTRGTVSFKIYRTDAVQPGPAPSPNTETATITGVTAYNPSKNMSAVLEYQRKICDDYAKQSVLQFNTNRKYMCAKSGPMWHADYRRHYDWCLGVPMSKSDSVLNSRQNDINNCISTPLDGDFMIKSITPYINYETGLLAKVEVLLETRSASNWTIGDYGNPTYGSLWMELSVKDPDQLSEMKIPIYRKYLFSMNSGKTLTFVAPYKGMSFQKGVNAIKIVAIPTPLMRLYIVQDYRSTSGAALMPGNVEVFYYYPVINANVSMVTKKGVVNHGLEIKIEKGPMINPLEKSP